MTEKVKNDFDMQAALLQGLREQFAPLEKQYLLLGGQVAMQELFVDTRSLPTRQLLDGTYNGRPAVVELVEVLTDNTSNALGVNVRNSMRMIVSDNENKIVLCDVAITRPQNRESWEAEVGDYHAQVTRDGGNPGITWRKASGLVDGDDKQPLGLSQEIHEVISMVKGIVKK